MEGRAITRFSVDGERNSALRNGVTRLLEEGGFSRTRTGTVEVGMEAAAPFSVAHLAAAIEMLLDPGSTAVETQGSVDHIWLYIDKGL